MPRPARWLPISATYRDRLKDTTRTKPSYHRWNRLLLCRTSVHGKANRHLGRLIVSHLQREKDQETSRNVKRRNKDEQRPHGNYFRNKFEVDPFTHLNLIGINDEERQNEELSEIDNMLERAKQNSVPDSHCHKLQISVCHYSTTFDTQFSSTPNKVEPLRIKFIPEARPVRLKLRNNNQS